MRTRGTPPPNNSSLRRHFAIMLPLRPVNLCGSAHAAPPTSLHHTMKHALSTAIFAAALLCLTGCGDDPATTKAPGAKSTHAGNQAGARELLSAFLKPGADLKALSAELKPGTADYAAVFTGDFAAKARRPRRRSGPQIPNSAPRRGRRNCCSTASPPRTSRVGRRTRRMSCPAGIRDQRQVPGRSARLSLQVCEAGRNQRHGLRWSGVCEWPVAPLSQALPGGGGVSAVEPVFSRVPARTGL